MTRPVEAAPGGGGTAERRAGAAAPKIHDLGYQRYDGPRTPHGQRYLTVMRIALRLSLKWWLWVTLVFAVAQVAIFGVVMYFLGRVSEIPVGLDAPRPDFLVLKLLTEWYGVIPLCFVVGLFAGGSAVADDARAGAFQFYFSRPVSKGHYLAGKLLAVCALTGAVVLGPTILLCGARAAMSPPSEIWHTGLLCLRGLGLGLVVALTLGIPAVALSSLSTSRGVVQGSWAAVFMLSWIIGRVIAALVGSSWPTLISIPANLQAVGAFVFGEPLANGVPWWTAALVLAVLLTASVALLRWRLQQVETITVS
jgi:ABC-type transport system involved in multi-copper enzyme maturation permease subunit